MSNHPTHSQDEYEEDDEFDDEEFDDEDAETPEESGTEAAKNFLLSRRGLLVGVLATAGLGVGGYLKLREKGPEGPEGPGGKELMKGYSKLYDPANPIDLAQERIRHMYVVEQVAAGNIPSSSRHLATIEVKGESGAVLQFEVVPHGIRVGHDDDYVEIPLDGPHTMAACEIQGLTLGNNWMMGKVREKAFKTKGKVPFFAYASLAKALKVPYDGGPPDGVKMKSPAFIQKHNEMLHAWLTKYKIGNDKLISGYVKEVTQDPNQSAKGHVATYPGYVDPPIDGRHEVAADRHEFTYFDYSHLGRCVKWEMTLNGKPITMGEFFSSAEYRKDFGFDAGASKAVLRPYKYGPELLKFMKDNGYLRYDPTENDETDAGTEKKKTPVRKKKKRRWHF